MLPGAALYCSDTKDTSDMFSGRWINGTINGEGDSRLRSSCGLRVDYELKESAGLGGRNMPWGRYCWHPESCLLHPFSRTRMCHILNNHSILLIGDSVQYMFYQALMMQFAGHAQMSDQETPQEQLETAKETYRTICTSPRGSVKVKFLRNDHLSPNQSYPHNNDFTPLLRNYDIIIVNTGVHVLPYDDFRRETNVGAKIFAGALRNTTKLLLYRTTPVPHPYCNKNDVIDFSPAFKAETARQIYYDEESPFNKYQWYVLPRRDGYSLRTYAQNLAKENFVVMDVGSMMSRRKDGHRTNHLQCNPVDKKCSGSDCLHYWLPSGVDAWVQILFNLLVRRLKGI